MDHSGNTSGDVNPLPSNFFNTSSFTQPLNPNPNPMYNLDTLWSRPSNSNPTSTHDPFHDPNSVDDPNPGFGPEKVDVNVTKNPKKRTRASRRAPTTVLTTDTTNFRQMVQEFTGIPPDPFSSSGYANRFGVYSGSAVPMQPVRPSVHKIITPYQSIGFTKQPLNLSNLSNMGNLQNQMFPFQSVSQVNASVRENQGLETSSGLSTNMKRWRGQDDNLMNFEGVNGNYENDVVCSGDGEQHQLPGHEDSWSF